ncbi:MAG: hypothetical protein IJR13_00690 [Bacteroidales bacterium]|nr:hypothetical protein [Bacteroidales bacterium]
MKKISFLFFMVFSYVAMADNVVSLNEARGIADAYYGAFQRIARLPDGEEVLRNSQKLFKAIGVDDNGNEIGGEFNVPNDIGIIFGTDNGLDNITIRHYVNKIREFSRRDNLVFSYDIQSSRYLYSPHMNGDKRIPDYALVIVKKTLSASTISPKVIWDTMFINATTKSIILVKNGYRKMSLLSERELLKVADMMYDEERYEEAYQMYGEVLRRDPKSNVSYKLGVMTFKGEGCKQYSRKVRDYLVEFYWQKTIDGRAQLERHNIMLYDMGIPSFSGYESNPFPSNRLLAYNHNKKRFGYISAQGEMVIKQQYMAAYPFFSNGTAIVKTEKSEWMQIDTNGRALELYDNVSRVEHEYKYLSDWGRQLVVRKNGLVGVINRETGNLDVPMIYKRMWWLDNYIKPFFVVEWQDGKVGVLSFNGNEIVPIKHSIMLLIENDDKTTLLRETVKLLCDYDKATYQKLYERYGKKIPDAELKKIGQLYIINL